ncbi:MAG: sulfite exporter TauE/SafE family protein [Dehalococcoidia bacterium]|nr:sulfite exporter TauE/SafE family protein [Dehalococcoidia bacterium]
MEITLGLFAAVVITSLVCEYADASIGMGYGTTLSPILLAVGFAPLEVVPAVLIGQLAGGLVGGLAHHRLGNISLDFRRDTEIKGRLARLGYLPRSTDAKIVFILAITGIAGAAVGIFTAVNISEIALKIYIGAMVSAVGVIILLKRIREGAVSWKGLVGVGLVSSFNKSMSGGGYGPLVTGGQIISGGGIRNSVGNTTLAEALVCAVGFLGYVLLDVDIFWKLAVATSIGSIVAAPFAAMTVKKVSPNKLKYAIGLATLGLGIFTLVNTLT